MRHEIKIPIHSSHHIYFENWINSIRGIKRHYDNRHVNSIYYDTLNYQNARDNINGISNRSKTRVRWYNNNFTEKKLEIKIKKNNLGKKLYLNSKFFDDINNINQIKNFIIKKKDFLIKKDINQPCQSIIYLYDNLKPVTMVTYKRSYFKYENSIRITYDQEMIYSLIDKNCKPNDVFKDTKNIIEFKFEKKYYEKAKYLLNNLKFRQSRFSKYLRSLYSFNKAIYF